MVNYQQARSLVLDRFNDTTTGELGLVEGDVYDIQDSDTIETKYGWIFNCNSRLYFQTGNHRYLARGCGPVVVEKHDGSIHVLGSALNRNAQIKIYEIGRLPLPIWLRVLIIDVYVFLQYRKQGRS